ncbi:hypothetical protein P152DRAFT_48720 [Eremomyces bilateralis CBS 781.70]|uniref:DUF6589 domain-containing protein n=1 Tax=Eremomyces bilateralis CBS 781.70 TaxID=1392243 RepID=A0A6G1G191_9PEZI|nr:uncharacterized protein P152DRAFT_48720 [Eremomyces bilateralis CBS 781.70]KAF1811690.1 hypothetical protein P152DRAFT_48720 [Eremomyces bilateralis CBS 781.70]
MHTFLVYEAIRHVHQEKVDAAFKKDLSLVPCYPEIKRLQAKGYATELHHLQAAPFDEGTIDGTYQVHTNIWLDRLRFKSNPPSTDFDERLWLVWSDQKTAQHIRSLKSAQRNATLPFDRRECMLGPCALFHVLQNLVLTIIRTHFEGEKGTSDATLLSDILYLGRKGYSRESPKFYLFDPLLKQSFSARILMV